MPLFLPSQCKVCGTGQLPPDARFCRNCGRPVQATEPAGGNARAIGVAVAILVFVGLIGVGLLVMASVRLTRTTAGTSAADAVTPVSPTAVPPPASRPILALPLTYEAPLASARPAEPPTPANAPAADSSPAGPPPPAAPQRPGDTDLSADPLALYAGGPAADRLTVHGLGVGTPLAVIQAGLLDESAPDHLRDGYGNLYAVDDHRINEVHIHDPDLLAHWPIDGKAALFARFGPPEETYLDDNADLVTYEYPSRGVNVRWDTKAERIDEVVLDRPATSTAH